mmetsp:Transcript_21353/g.54558  ORF Transcript_21353/g.54558 Transcript_21353/m.54558 type:complete len:221 (-) Transcript_21353:253-915(-)
MIFCSTKPKMTRAKSYMLSSMRSSSMASTTSTVVFATSTGWGRSKDMKRACAQAKYTLSRKKNTNRIRYSRATHSENRTSSAASLVKSHTARAPCQCMLRIMAVPPSHANPVCTSWKFAAKKDLLNWLIVMECTIAMGTSTNNGCVSSDSSSPLLSTTGRPAAILPQSRPMTPVAAAPNMAKDFVRRTKSARYSFSSVGSSNSKVSQCILWPYLFQISFR